MKKHISFPSIEQFRHVVASVNRQANYVGAGVNGDAIYDPNLPKPVLTFKGTVKLHGCFSSNTLITLANGEQSHIKDININDSILSYDIENNKYVISKVTNKFIKNIDIKWIKLYFDNDTNIECTEDHKFYTKNRGWIEAKDLTENDIFILDKDEFTLVP